MERHTKKGQKGAAEEVTPKSVSVSPDFAVFSEVSVDEPLTHLE